MISNNTIDREIAELKDKITAICILFKNLNAKEYRDNRDSLDEKVRKAQDNVDYKHLNSLRNNALAVFDKCNEMMMAK